MRPTATRQITPLHVSGWRNEILPRLALAGSLLLVTGLVVGLV